MKKTIFIFALMPIMAYGQNDSLKVRELDEIIVAAQMQRTDSQKTVYMPTLRQKESSADGYALLNQMQIPQINVNPMSNAVTTATNQGVALFINGLPASRDDVNALNPSDVRKVEYCDFPTDAKFQRAPHVVNFITAKYEYGGYTKLSAKERLLVNSGSGQLYSKMAYKEMDYDVIVTGDYESGSHIGTDNHELYRLGIGDVERTTTMQSGKYRERDAYGAFRATWQHKGITFRNKVGYNGRFIPQNTTEGSVTIFDNTSGYIQSNTSRSNAVDWEGNMAVDFSKGWSLSGNFNAAYTRNHSDQAYQEITNNALEKDLTTRQELQLNKNLSKNVSVFLQSITGTDRSRVNYTGSADAANDFYLFYAAPMIGTSVNIGKVYGSADVGFAYEHNSINGYITNDYYPFVHLNTQYSPNNKNSMGLFVQYATMSPDIAQKSPNILQENEVLYITGNPELKNSRHTSVALNYTWLPSNMWQMTAYAVMFRIANRQVPIYSPNGPDGMMLKRYENNGDYNHGQIGVNLSGKFLEGKLTASISPRVLLYHTTGAYHFSKYPFSGSVNINYYLGNFHFNLYWSSRNSYVDGEDCFYRKMPSEYALTAGWSHKDWNIELMGSNLFRSSWLTNTGYLQSQYYDCTRRQYGNDRHRRVSLTLSYTFNYGKKVTPADELQKESGTNSNILK